MRAMQAKGQAFAHFILGIEIRINHPVLAGGGRIELHERFEYAEECFRRLYTNDQPPRTLTLGLLHSSRPSYAHPPDSNLQRVSLWANVSLRNTLRMVARALERRMLGTAADNGRPPDSWPRFWCIMFTRLLPKSTHAILRPWRVIVQCPPERCIGLPHS